MHNRFGVQIYKGLSSESGYSFVSNGSTMNSGIDPNTVINDATGKRVLFTGVTAVDIDGPMPTDSNVIKSTNYQVSVIPSISGAVLTITPSTGTFLPGKYIYHITADAITDIPGNFFAGRTNMFIVA